MSEAMPVEERVEQVFPVGKTEDGRYVKREGEYRDLDPAFREKQKAATIETVKGIENDDIDVVKLNAPTGAGKSLILYTASRVTGGRSFITTPLNALVDQMEDDRFMDGDIICIKGRNNYNCINEKDKGTPVDEAICQRQSDFDCDVRDSCPYYGRVDAALQHPDVVTNLSYLMSMGMIPDEVEGTFNSRTKLSVDECQNIEDFAMNFISFTVSKRAMPDDVWKNVSIPKDRYEDDMDYLVEWIEDEVLGAVRELLNRLSTIAVMDKEQSSIQEDLKQYQMRVENFLDDVRQNEWVAEIQTEMRKNKPNERKVVFEPVEIGRFLKNLLWDMGDTVILSSATIPGNGWMQDIGLGNQRVKEVKLGSTFPVENRRVVCNLDVGKMVSEYSDKNNNRKTNAWSMAKRIMELAMHHEGEKGFIHCRSYNIAQLLKRQYMNHDKVEIKGEEYRPSTWFRKNVMMQDRYRREETLQEWIESDKQVFFSVAMSEGVDLDGDKCRWQALAKVLYPFMTKRIKRKKEIADNNNDSQSFWRYYNRKAVIQIQQAYGRGVRSKEDECVFYILDSSATQQQGLIQMNAELFNEWFLEAVEGINVNPKRGI